MKRTAKTILILAALAVVAPLCATAQDLPLKAAPPTPAMGIQSPYAYATNPGANAAMAYMTIHNASGAPDTLIGAVSAIADSAELHTSQEVDQPTVIKEGLLTVPAGGDLMLDPIKLTGLHAPLKDGSSFSITLKFQNAGEITVAVPVRAAPAGMAMDKTAEKEEPAQVQAPSPPPAADPAPVASVTPAPAIPDKQTALASPAPAPEAKIESAANNAPLQLTPPAQPATPAKP